MKRTAHGEPLQERQKSPCVGLTHRRRWTVRNVWCPRCHAKPNRKCTAQPGDQHLTGKHKDRLVDGLRAGGTHYERSQRQQTLEKLATSGPAVLYQLSFKPPRPRPPQAFSDGPLFAPPPSLEP